MTWTSILIGIAIWIAASCAVAFWIGAARHLRLKREMMLRLQLEARRPRSIEDDWRRAGSI